VESGLPFVDEAGFLPLKDFFRPYSLGMAMTGQVLRDNSTIDLGSLSSVRSRIIRFDFTESASGIFTSSIPLKHGLLNTGGNFGDYPTPGLPNFYAARLRADPDGAGLAGIDSYWLNSTNSIRFSVTSGISPAGVPSYIPQMIDSAARILDVTALVTDIQDFDVSAVTSWGSDSYIPVSAPPFVGNVYAIKNAVTYALVKITADSEMSDAEMLEIITDFNASSGAQKNAGGVSAAREFGGSVLDGEPKGAYVYESDGHVLFRPYAVNPPSVRSSF
jgi:hypothetical protein